jgi:hypothetical protein
MASQYERGIPTDERLMKTSLISCAGNQDLADARVRRIKNLERYYQSQLEGFEELNARYTIEKAKRQIRINRLSQEAKQ